VRTTRSVWSSASWLLGASLGLLVLGSGGVAFAQASALGNPYGPGAGASVGATATVGSSATVGPATPPALPPSYSDATIPTPPDGGVVSVYPAPRVSGVVADNPNVHIATSTATRLRALDADLSILAARGGGNFLDGALMLASAAATTTWAVLLDTSGAPGVVSYAAIYLYMYSGAAVGRAILSFALMTNPGAASIRYSHMPMGTRAEVRERLRYGELQLDGLAEQSRIQRILDGSINLAIGLAVIPAYLGPNNFQVPNIQDWFVIVLAGLSTVMGVVALVSTTEPERRQSAYHELRDRILATPEGMEDEDALERDAAEASGVSVAPIVSLGPTGGFAGATVTF
jgi:hypothetical protein